MRFISPEDSASRKVCILCEQPISPPVATITYPPSMKGGYICYTCWEENDFAETSETEPARYVSDAGKDSK